MARKPNGDVRLDYEMGGVKRIRTWEPRGAAALETTFRSDGAVLLQTVVETKKIESRIAEILLDCGGEAPKSVPYLEVLFDRPCPWCKKHALVRYAEAYRSRGEVPIVPLYHCRDCRGHSYHLTEEYLVHLVSSNPDLFESKDAERFKNDRDAFLSEVKAYIISSFASKKVRRID